MEKLFSLMPEIENLGRELVRINTQKNSVEYSQNGGRSWVMRCSNNSYGELLKLDDAAQVVRYNKKYDNILRISLLSNRRIDT